MKEKKSALEVASNVIKKVTWLEIVLEQKIKW